MITAQAANLIATRVKTVFDEIKARGGRAAIDFKDGEVILQCTKPTADTATWGLGKVPQPYTDSWVRLNQC